MDASKQLWRRTAYNSVKVIMSIVLTALLTTSLAVPAFMNTGAAGAGAFGHAQGSGGWISDIRGFVSDPLAYFAQRSPGARSSRDLVQLKHRMFKLARHGAKPQERVLANVRYPSTFPDYINDVIAPVHPGLFETAGPVPSFGGPGSVGSPGVPSSVVPVSVPGTNSGGGTGGNTAVPEPATWLTLIWGMALVGFGLRAKQRRFGKGAARIGFRA